MLIIRATESRGGSGKVKKRVSKSLLGLSTKIRKKKKDDDGRNVVKKRKSRMEETGAELEQESRMKKPSRSKQLQGAASPSKKAKNKAREREEGDVDLAVASPDAAVQPSEIRDGGDAVKDGAPTGMKKWLAEYHAERRDPETLQQEIDEFILQYDAREEQARAEREAAAAADGWTVVVGKGGRKKGADADGGLKVGAVSSAAALERAAKKRKKAAETTLDFYQFQRREQRRNELLNLQQKFENDKKKLAKLRAARKFTPY